MEFLNSVFGSGKDLSISQISIRAFTIFIVGWAIIRLSGRRSFGMRMPLDNVITILIGSVLGRAINSNASFIGTIIACIIIAIMHRLFALIGVYSETFDRLIKGRPKLMYKNGILNRKYMMKYSVTEKDILEGVRTNSNLENLDETKSIYLERDGQISVVKDKKKSE